MTAWAALTDRERLVLAEIRKCQGVAGAGVLAGLLGLTVAAVVHDAGALQVHGLVRRVKVTPRLVVYETTRKGDEALGEGAAETVEVTLRNVL